ncbi:MAG: AarF/ABC1/UbiB kinase family protein [Deltaproteobacteria bacterium]|nr:AarF/ABC1/UbiB kinase family protein [Deltaproteobacteria bacterium]
MDDERSTPLPPLRTNRRFITAYWTTFVVIFSYFWLRLRSRFFSMGYWDEHIIALHQKNARRIEDAILRLQGLFIKVGQLFSIMTNFLPAEFRSGLQNLQDAVPARPYSQIERRVREELGGDPLDIFASFEKEPIASASLGQVHEAMTQEGLKVAVKVQHLGVEGMTRSDLKTIRRIVGILRFFLRVRGLDNFYQEIRSMILDELDFIHEAAHIEEIAQNFENNDQVILPRVIADLSTTRVLTLEFADGIKITDNEKIRAAGLDPGQVAKDLTKAYCQMIFVDGVYHADPHPGNILVQPDGRLVFLDFGAVGRLSTSMRQGISSFLEAIIKGDEKQLLRALRAMGFLQVGSDSAAAAERVIEHFHRKFQEDIRLEEFSLSSVKIDPSKGLEALADFRQMDVGIRQLSAAFYIPKEWVLLERTGLLLAGLCTHLDPDMNPAETVRPYLEEFVLGKDQDWSEMLFNLSREKLLSFLSLPNQIDKLIHRVLAGNVTYRIEGISAGVERLYAAGHQVIFAFLASVSAGIGIYFHHVKSLEMARYSGYTACGFIVLLALSMLHARRFRNGGK